MAKLVTANKAGMAYEAIRKDVFEQKEMDKNNQVIKMTKILVQRNKLPFGKAVLVAKRAYRMGVRSSK